MTILSAILTRIKSHFPLFQEDEAQRSFKDPYSDMDSMHDKEMERLVKVIEQMKNNNGAPYQ